MKIHEYQAKELIEKFNVPIPKGNVAYTIDDAMRVASEIENDIYVVKAQIHAGGRGKGGGVKVSKGIEEMKTNFENILGMNLVTHQTGKEGKEVKKVLIEEGLNIEKEFYFGIVLDRKTSKIALMASCEGGMEIEKVASETPEKIITELVSFSDELPAYIARNIAFKLGLTGKAFKSSLSFFSNLYKFFVKMDASLVEINPMVLTCEGDIIALDAKVNFDSSAIFKHKELLEYHDPDEEDPKELEASKHDLSYISLNGNIGCMVNGAGLAMATMDIIKMHGGEPANFLDVGGTADEERVSQAFKIITQDEKVKAILVNIFGGIVKCDVIASGIVAASKKLELKVPLIIRLEGTNVELGKKILQESGLDLITADDMADAAKKAVDATK
ncbi:MAG: ADP-forming succinate--CoA ligase subunit beta [Pseudomonadota bacterium]